jgi:hypothetical protein
MTILIRWGVQNENIKAITCRPAHHAIGSPDRSHRAPTIGEGRESRDIHMNSLLEMMMPMAVFLQVKSLEKQGGPSPEDMAKIQETSDMLGEHGDILLHGCGKKGECADLFNRTAHAIAVLAFVPGGVELFGTKFEAKRREAKA